MWVAAAVAKSLQLCPTLCDPRDGSPPGSSVPGILQTRTLEWVAISFSNAWKWEVKVKSLSRVWLVVTPWTAAHQAPPSMAVAYNVTNKHECLVYVCAHSAAQSCLTLCDPMDCSLPGSSIHGIFQTRVLEWVAISFSRYETYHQTNGLKFFGSSPHALTPPWLVAIQLRESLSKHFGTLIRTPKTYNYSV